MDQPTHQHPGPIGSTRILVAICSSALLSVLVALALPPFLPTIADETGASVALLGQVPGVASLVAAALGLIGGPVADHYGHRRALLVGVAAVAVGAVGTALAWSLATLLLATLATSVSRALVQPVGLTIASTHFAGAARRRAISFTVAAVAGAGILGVPLLTAVDAAMGWRAAFGVLGIISLAVAVLVLAALPRDAPASGARLRLGEVVAAYRPLLADRPTVGLIAANFVRVTGLWCMGIYLSAYLVQAHGLSTAAAGFAFTAFGGGLFAGSLLSGGRLGGWPPRTTVVVCSALAGLVLGVSMAAPLPPIGVMAVVFVGAAINGVGNVASTTLLANEALAGRATTMTVNQSAFSLAGAAGAGAGGLLLVLGGYPAIGWASPLFGFGAALLTWRSRPRV